MENGEIKMTFDENYIYPTTPEELACFYGWEGETRHIRWQLTKINHVDLEVIKLQGDEYRIPLPTLSDLKVGDVVRFKDSNGNYQIEELYNYYYKSLVLENMIPKDSKKGYLNDIELHLGRNLWVKVKV